VKTAHEPLPEHLLVERMTVRMMYDPSLLDDVYAGRPVEGLTDRARAMITAADRRAWTTDPQRLARTMTALAEEYLVSTARVGVPHLKTFFQSDAFHRAVMERGVLALVLGEWLRPDAGPYALVEHAIACVRRAEIPPGEGIVRSPVYIPLDVPLGTLASWQVARAALGQHPIDTLARGGLKIEAPPGGGSEHVLVELDPQGEAGAGYIPEALFNLLSALDVPQTWESAVVAARGAGAGEEAEAVLMDLLQEGLLIEVSA
jgi:hypothetical protein